jgi:OmpA-OmpF porin, OOP family
MQPSVALIGALLAVLATRGLAHAQDVDLERWRPALDADGFLGVQGTRTPGPGRLSLGLFTHYSSRLLKTESEAGEEVQPVADRLAANLSAELGIGERAALGLSMPLVLHQSGEQVAEADPELQAFAPGDPTVSLRYRLIGDVAGVLDSADGPGLGLQIGASLPAGYDDAYTGEGAVRAEAQLLADVYLLNAGVGASIGIRHRFESRDVLDVHLRDEMTFGVAVKVPVPGLYPLEGLVEFRGATAFQGSLTTYLELTVGARYALARGLSLSFAAGPGLGEAIGTPALRVIAGLWYSESDPDSDKDGIPDDVDVCPPLPEDLDGFEDQDGCPDPDNDNDLVPDSDDLCPDQEAQEGADANEDGCTD